MSRKDFRGVLAIGILVGFLVQPVITNFVNELTKQFGMTSGGLRVAFFAFFTILAPCALFVASLLGKLLPVLYQFAKFAAVGSLNSFMDLGIFNLETALYGGIPGAEIFAAFKAVSFLVATTNSFFWNKYWTFEAGGSVRAGEAAKFYGIAIAGAFLNVGMATFVKGLAPSALPINFWVNIVAPIAGIFTVLFWNFMGYKFFVFAKKTEG
jgi:putative flippase GtrA